MDLLAELRAICGEHGVLAGDDLATRAGDWLGLVRCQAKAVVLPRSTAEVSAVMRLCHRAGQPVAPAGGLTGLVRGAEAGPNEVQISFEKMRALGPVDPLGRTLVAEAGVPLQLVQEEAERHGLIYAVDLGARGSASVGGTISTNAGGNQVVRYGMTRDNVLGLEVVLADGTVLSSMNHLLKNNAAYDLKQLFIGSEGTLGLVTRAVLKLHPRPTSQATALLAADSFAAVTDLFRRCDARLGPMLTSFEVMWQNHYRLIAEETGRHVPPLPAGHGWYVLVEASGMAGERDEEDFTALMGALIEDGLAADAVVAASLAQRKALWAIREDIEGLFHTLMPAAVFDVSLPMAEMAAYVAGLETAVAAQWGGAARTVVFGHIGDGNLHIVIAPRPWDEAARHRAEELVYRPLAAIAGSVSAEHGIGLEKRDWLEVSRNAEERALMRQLKAALDPKALLNPGKVI